MKKLVVVADDFGWTEGVNLGILKAYKEGIVTEISLMLSSPATKEALNYIKKENINDVGLHMTLLGQGKSHEFLTRDDYNKIFKDKTDADIAKMVEDEISLFEKYVGFKPSHIAPQYGIHGNLKLLDILIEYASKNNIAMRIPKTALMGGAEARDNYAAEVVFKRKNIKKTNYLFGHVLGDDLDEIKKLFLDELGRVNDGESAEMFLHPGYFDKEMLGYSTLGYERARDLALTLDTKFKKDILKLGFKFSSYTKL